MTKVWVEHPSPPCRVSNPPLPPPPQASTPDWAAHTNITSSSRWYATITIIYRDYYFTTTTITTTFDTIITTTSIITITTIKCDSGLFTILSTTTPLPPSPKLLSLVVVLLCSITFHFLPLPPHITTCTVPTPPQFSSSRFLTI